MRDTETWLMAHMRHIKQEQKERDILTNCPKTYFPEIAERLIVAMNTLCNLAIWFDDNNHHDDFSAIHTSISILERNFGITCKHGRAKSLKKYELDEIEYQKHIREWCGASEDTEIVTLNC